MPIGTKQLRPWLPTLEDDELLSQTQVLRYQQRLRLEEQLSYAVAAGPAGVDVTDSARGFAYCRFELSAQQAAVRSLSVIQRT